MRFSFVLLLHSLLLVATAWAQPSTLQIGTAPATAGDTVYLSVTIDSPESLLTLQGSLRWDPAALDFVSFVDSDLPGFTTLNLGMTGATAGVLRYSWEAAMLQSIILPSGTLVMQLGWRVLDTATTGLLPVRFDDAPLTREIIIERGNDIAELTGVNYLPGGVYLNAEEGALVAVIDQSTVRDQCQRDYTVLGAVVAGGTPPYRYEWSGPGLTSGTAGQILAAVAGTYRLQVTDQAGNTITDTYDINSEAATSLIEFTNARSSTCGTATGSALVVPRCREARYAYRWNTGDTTASLNQTLVPGTYRVTVTHLATRMEEVREVMVKSGLIAVVQQLNPFCDDGRELRPQPLFGINEVVSYRWSTGDTSRVLPSAAAGDYILTASTASGCTDTLTVTVENLPPVEVPYTLYQSCEQGNNQLVFTLRSTSEQPYRITVGNGSTQEVYTQLVVPLENIVVPTNLDITIVGPDNRVHSRRFTAQPCTVLNSRTQVAASDQLAAVGETVRVPIRAYQLQEQYPQQTRLLVNWDYCHLRFDSVRAIIEGELVETPLYPGEDRNFNITLWQFPDVTPNDTVVVAEFYLTALRAGQSYFNLHVPGSDQLAVQSALITVVADEQRQWPGDTNQDGQINELDLLPIGLAYGSTGPSRPEMGTAPLLFFSAPWGQTTPVTSINYRYIDTDGNGQIAAADTLAIVRNWGSAAFEGSQSGTPRSTGVPLYVRPDTLRAGQWAALSIMLGEEVNPASEAYGLAWVIQYDPLAVSPGTVAVDLSDNWLGADLTLVYHDSVQHRLHLALSRTDGQSVSGAGVLGQLRFRVPESAVGVAAFAVEQSRLINAQEMEQAVDQSSVPSPIDPSTAWHDPVLDQRLRLYPSPAAHLLYLSTDLPITRLLITDLYGRVQWQQGAYTDGIDVSAWPAGVYVLRLDGPQGSIVQRWMKQ